MIYHFYQKEWKLNKSNENYKDCLEATQLESKANHLEKNQIGIDKLKKCIKNS